MAEGIWDSSLWDGAEWALIFDWNDTMGNMIRPRRLLGQQTLTVSSTAVGFTSTNYHVSTGPNGTNTTRASLAYVTVEDAPVRWSIVGTPTASTGGHKVLGGSPGFWLFSDSDIQNFRAIRTGATDGLIHATFWE